jgi:DASS family divalent anion:Na+ symporter
MKVALAVAVGLALWWIPPPNGLELKAWRLFALFVSTIVAVIAKPFPMGLVALLALGVSLATSLLTFQEAFSGFSNEVVWLIVFAFFVSRAFIATGLGARVAYGVMKLMGKNSLGLGYGLVATDLLLAPTIPSMTARAGGVIYPILKGLTEIFTGRSHDPNMGAFLTLAAFQGTAISSAMFLTAMAGNPLIVELAKEGKIALTWTSWAVAAFVPGMVSLLVVPYVVYRLCTPSIRNTPHAKEMAEERLRAMGPMKQGEWIALGTLLLLIGLWIFGTLIDLKATTAALFGVMILLVTGVLKWKDVLEESSAWDTFLWFSILVTLATFLGKFGMASWFSKAIAAHVTGLHWSVGFGVIALLYFYTHYFFASAVAHICAMYAPLLLAAIALGTPPELAALVLAFFSNLFGGLTHYGSGPAPILFGAGYVSVGQWWKVGGYVSAINIAIWAVVGGAWWKVLGYW